LKVKISQKANGINELNGYDIRGMMLKKAHGGYHGLWVFKNAL